MDKQLRTRLNVVEALDGCMQDRPIGRVHVVDVCQAAGISRTTFYQYFRDIDDVTTWMWDFLMDETLYQAGRRWSCYEAHLHKFEALLGYKHFFMCAFLPTEYSSITQHGGRVMQEHFEEVIANKMGHALSQQQSLEIEFFVTGAKHMTRRWVEGNMKESPELIAHVFANSMAEFAKPYLEADSAYDASAASEHDAQVREILAKHGIHFEV